MREVVQAALEAVSFGGWRLEVVGGSRRSAANHDAGGVASPRHSGLAGTARQQ